MYVIWTAPRDPPAQEAPLPSPSSPFSPPARKSPTTSASQLVCHLPSLLFFFFERRGGKKKCFCRTRLLPSPLPPTPQKKSSKSHLPLQSTTYYDKKHQKGGRGKGGRDKATLFSLLPLPPNFCSHEREKKNPLQLLSPFASPPPLSPSLSLPMRLTLPLCLCRQRHTPSKQISCPRGRGTRRGGEEEEGRKFLGPPVQ